MEQSNVIIEIELKEMLLYNDSVTIKLQIDGDDIKEIELRRRKENNEGKERENTVRRDKILH